MYLIKDWSKIIVWNNRKQSNCFKLTLLKKNILNYIGLHFEYEDDLNKRSLIIHSKNKKLIDGI